ncbi:MULTISPECIES: AAA family ATPase [Salinibacter]|uniref:AAA family ATPase n=1 Tax=Salinibacter TaxID=146918 RepID=UPI001ABAB798|nr:MULTISPECIES: SMC family ATPase [Salinibacter]
MVPVRLELKNFLSYGTEAPPLEFDHFDVACLSGGNGEGKSALLDAMTWAVWGAARKSSGRRKPDEELIRIGTRHMRVAFTFDLEDTRYRVVRSFSRSETGKTTSSDLEFQLHDAAGTDYRPLTGATQRETQARIEDTLGLDYDTFINSAFLLQGRSDEFTQKRPSQRKEILTRILNLGRYEALEDEARDHWREAKERQQRAAAEVERLETALEDVPDWEEEREAVQADIEAQTEALSGLRDREKALTQKRATLEATAREAESIRESMASLDDRIEEHRDEIEALTARIEEAEALLEDRTAIEEAYDDHQSLVAERDALEDTRERHRTLKQKMDDLSSSLQERRNDVERRLERLRAERAGIEESLDDCRETLAQRAEVETRLRRAQAARQQVPERKRVRRRRDRLEQRKAEAREAIVGARQQLRGEIETLRAQIEEEAEALERREQIEARIDALRSKQETRAALDERMAEIEDDGTARSQAVQEQAGQLEALRDEREREAEELRRFREADGDVCPTCGTELTDAHREEAEATLRSHIDELDTAIESARAQLDEEKERRAELRRTYRQLQDKREALDDVGEALATAQEQKRALEATAEALAAHREKAERLGQRLTEGRYAESARRQWQACKQRLAETEVDTDAFEALQNRAAQFDRYADRLAEIERAAARREELAQKRDERDEKIEQLRTALDENRVAEDLQEDMEDLRAEIDALEFDPDRFQEIRERLQALSDVPDRHNALVNAQENRTEWAEQRTRIRDRMEGAQEEKQGLDERLAECESALEDKPEVVAEQESVSEQVEAEEEALTDLQQRLGKLDAQLEQAAADREALEAARKERQDAAAARQRYKHLRAAFGKNGIPSLIIEETLPDIEERANRILDRLTDGRMHVRLDTLKEKKSGGTKETLEIIITDEHGAPRPYETYSGGESFRVNFALRVALAQLLAERSGVRVRTLVIDEGFGTQDEAGIERLVEAIQAIREDFAKILVITHLERLKRAFPVRIEVEKDPSVGSTFELVGA